MRDHSSMNEDSCWLIKYDTLGHQIWSKWISPINDSIFLSPQRMILNSNGNIIIVGGYRYGYSSSGVFFYELSEDGDSILFKSLNTIPFDIKQYNQSYWCLSPLDNRLYELDGNGTLVDSMQTIASEDAINAVEITNDFLFVLSKSDTTNNSTIEKFDLQTKSLVLQKTELEPYLYITKGLNSSNNSLIIFSGHKIKKLDIDLNNISTSNVTSQNHSLSFQFIHATTDGGFIAGGYSLFMNSIQQNAIIKIDKDGNTQWLRLIPETGWTFVHHGIEADDRGFVCIRTNFNDTYIFKVNENGVFTNHGEVVKLMDFRLFPNPTSNLLNIQAEEVLNGQLEIYNISGQLVHHQLLNRINTTSIDVSQLQSGVYLLNFISESGENFVQKWIKR